MPYNHASQAMSLSALKLACQLVTLAACCTKQLLGAVVLSVKQQRWKQLEQSVDLSAFVCSKYACCTAKMTGARTLPELQGHPQQCPALMHSALQSHDCLTYKKVTKAYTEMDEQMEVTCAGGF